jgi:hypothetical protein
VVVFATLGAARRPPIGRRRPRVDDSGAGPEPIAITRVSAVGTEAFAGHEQAARWLESLRTDAGERERFVDESLAVVNRAVHAHRLAAADPHVNEVGLDQATVVRIGYGTGDELVAGAWTSAYILPRSQRRARRRALIEPQQELARIVGGHSRPYASEDLALRARLDLEQGRTAQCALQLEAALVALSSELEDDEQADARASALLARREELRAIAAQALRRPREDASGEALSESISELERVLRRRRHGRQQR